MISAIFVGRHGLEVVGMDTSMNDLIARVGASFEYERLPTEPVGSTTVTFAGVPAGSEIRVFFPDATEASGVESCVADQALSWSVFAPGNANNTVRIVVIDMAHKIKEFNYTAQLGNQSIPVQPENDKWWSNP